MKNYIGISRDHSASMTPLRVPAAKDYNNLIADIKGAALNHSIDTIVSVIKCGVGHTAANIRDVINSSVAAIKPLPETVHGYEASGSGTPLFDSVLMLIEDLEKVPDASNPDVSFLVMAITDGEDNRSYYKSKLIQKIRTLQATDRWTFVFRVPKGYKYNLISLGIPEGNILEWDQTAKGVETATKVTTQAIEAYYTGVKSGVKSTDRFFTNIDKKAAREAIKTSMTDITDEVTIWNVKPSENDMQIRAFIESKGVTFQKGKAFYQLTKPEKAVQDYKVIVIKDKKAGKTYAGAVARDLLGLPHVGTAKVAPGDHAGFDVYIQSTSVNRKLPEGSRVLYWKNAS